MNIYTVYLIILYRFYTNVWVGMDDAKCDFMFYFACLVFMNIKHKYMI